MKIVIPGGSGQVGTMFARQFHADGHAVTILSRRPKSDADAPWRIVAWDARTAGAWATEFEDADAVINLAGRNVNCRATPENKKEILQSRLDSVRVVGEAIAAAKHPPRVWLQAATATIYSHRYDAPNDDVTGIIGGHEPDAPEKWHFSVEVAEQWEAATASFALPATRTVELRSSMIMSADRGGVFNVLLNLVRAGLGGANGDGRQYVAWIHETDFVRAAYHLVEHDTLSGAVNVCAPNPLPNAEFMRELRAAWGMPLGLPAAAWMLEIGAVFLQTESELILKSRRVVPKRLTDDGFVFTFAQWSDAARNLCARWRKAEG